MMEPTQSSEALLNTFWFIAIPVSLVFVIQAVMTFMGTDSHDGMQADFDGDLGGTDAPFELFSLRNLIHFLLGFSWTGISLHSVISSPALLITLSVLVGCLFVYMFFAILRQLKKLSEDNSFS
ncbi:MAG: serine protease, partial [Flavobacteriales bacterium]